MNLETKRRLFQPKLHDLTKTLFFPLPHPFLSHAFSFSLHRNPLPSCSTPIALCRVSLPSHWLPAPSRNPQEHCLYCHPHHLLSPSFSCHFECEKVNPILTISCTYHCIYNFVSRCIVGVKLVIICMNLDLNIMILRILNEWVFRCVSMDKLGLDVVYWFIFLLIHFVFKLEDCVCV